MLCPIWRCEGEHTQDIQDAKWDFGPVKPSFTLQERVLSLLCSFGEVLIEAYLVVLPADILKFPELSQELLLLKAQETYNERPWGALCLAVKSNQ